MGNCFYPDYKNIESSTDKTDMWSFQGECCICMENPIQAAILDCGHLHFCIKCAKSLHKNSNLSLRFCPLCRKEIKGYAVFNPIFNK